MEPKLKILKFVFIGDSSVGKSSILFRFSDDSFSQHFVSTIGIDFKIRTVDIKGEKVKLQIWDTAGQERFRTITKSYYRGAHCILIAFDLTNEKSFNNIDVWFREAEDITKCYKVLVGSKCDLVDNDKSKQCVTDERIKALCGKYNMKYYSVSAKTGKNIENLFIETAQNLCDKEKRATESIENTVIKPVKQQPKKKSFCVII